MEIEIEPWVAYGCDFGPVMVNSLFSETLGRIAVMAFCAGSEFLYMERQGAHPAGTLVPENLVRPHVNVAAATSFPMAMVFAYSQKMERALYNLSSEHDSFGAGITVCGIWKRDILVDECKVIVVASENPFFDADGFLALLSDELGGDGQAEDRSVPYFAEKLGYRRGSIPYETDDVTQLAITELLVNFEFDETRQVVGPAPELSLDNF